MKYDFTNFDDFIAEANKRGLKVLPQSPTYEQPHPSDAYRPVFIGIRQFNNNPQFPGDSHIDILYGMWMDMPGGGGVGTLFDTDSEFSDWINE